MRKFFIVFMLLLLPLRGWMGDAMAYSMLPDAMDSIAASARLSSASSGLDHPKMQMAMPCHEIASSDAAQDNTPAQSQCNSCQVCHLSTFVSPSFATPAVLQHQAPPAHVHTVWASADLARQAKPPVL
jgi:hypothetical protein